MEKWSVKKILDWAIDFFKGKEVNQPRLSAELLLAAVLDLSRIDLYLNYNKVLSAEELKTYKNFIIKRLEHVPIQYILHEAHFRNIRLSISEDVLIPRPETELIVERSLDIAEKILTEKGRITIADIGTGSGAIALSFYSELKKRSGTVSGEAFYCNILATDNSQDALELAQKNARIILEPEDLENIEFVNCDILPDADLPASKKYHEKIDIVISNPPYIREKDYIGLPREVREHEPKGALVAGDTGLEVYERILASITPFLITTYPAHIVLETDPIVSKNLLELVEATREFNQVFIEKDYNKKDRILIANR